jgi:hypothetical protein
VLYFRYMSTLGDIEAALPNLSDTELKQLAADLDRLFRERKGASIYQDTHGTLTEADLIIAADRAFQEYDKAEGTDADRQAR